MHYKWDGQNPHLSFAQQQKDVISTYCTKHSHIPFHPLEKYLLPQEHTTGPSTASITNLEVNVDNFISMTNNLDYKNIQHLSRAILHGIHSIFPPPSVTGHSGEDPISIKKLREKEGLFEYKKEVLGWLINGQTFTITLPSKKPSKIVDQIHNMITTKAVKLKDLQKFQGKLIHASLGVPGGKGLMSPIYEATKQEREHVKLNYNLKQCISDWAILIQQVASRPTSVKELVPQLPNFVGYVDASKQGVGGVWVNGSEQLQHQWVWRLEWSDTIKNNLVSASNPKGTISINDLEMAGILLAWLVLEQVAENQLTYKHVGIFCDNMSTVMWSSK